VFLNNDLLNLHKIRQYLRFMRYKVFTVLRIKLYLSAESPGLFFHDRYAGVRNRWSTSSIKRVPRAYRSRGGGEIHDTSRAARPTKSASDFDLIIDRCPPAVDDAMIFIDRGIVGICAEILPTTRNSVSDRAQCIAFGCNGDATERAYNPAILWNHTYGGRLLCEESVTFFEFSCFIIRNFIFRNKWKFMLYKETFMRYK